MMPRLKLRYGAALVLLLSMLAFVATSCGPANYSNRRVTYSVHTGYGPYYSYGYNYYPSYGYHEPVYGYGPDVPIAPPPMGGGGYPGPDYDFPEATPMPDYDDFGGFDDVGMDFYD